jgi:antitoxin MazE
METKLINIGNSKGILIPAKVLKLLGLKDRVQIAIENNKMVIEAIGEQPRANWSEQFAKANGVNDDSELIPDVFEDESLEDWTW